MTSTETAYAPGSEGTYAVFAHVNAEKSPFYRAILRAFVAERARFAIALRPSEIHAALATTSGPAIYGDLAFAPGYDPVFPSIVGSPSSTRLPKALSFLPWLPSTALSSTLLSFTVSDIRAALKFVADLAEQESFHPLPLPAV